MLQPGASLRAVLSLLRQSPYGAWELTQEPLETAWRIPLVTSWSTAWLYDNQSTTARPNDSGRAFRPWPSPRYQ